MHGGWSLSKFVRYMLGAFNFFPNHKTTHFMRLVDSPSMLKGYNAYDVWSSDSKMKNVWIDDQDVNCVYSLEIRLESKPDEEGIIHYFRLNEVSQYKYMI